MTKFLASPGLHIDHAGDEDAGIADDHPARLEHERAAEIVGDALDHGGIGIGCRRRVTARVIGNAEAAAEVDMRDGVAVGAQRLHEFRQDAERGFHPAQIGDLAADMHVGAGDLDPRQFGRVGIDRTGAGDRNAELVLGFAGGDLGVGAGIDIGVDPHRDPRRLAGFGRQPRQQIELRFGFDIDAENAGLERRAQFGLGLADAREQDLLRRDAGGQRALQFAARHHVGAGTELGQRPEHRLVGIRLHGVAHHRLLAGEGVGKDAVMAFQGRG